MINFIGKSGEERKVEESVVVVENVEAAEEPKVEKQKKASTKDAVKKSATTKPATKSSTTKKTDEK